MADRLNPNWANNMIAQLNRGGTIDAIVDFNKAAQWLIVQLSSRGLNFKVYNLGAGVKRITTETDKCPCCKRKL